MFRDFAKQEFDRLSDAGAIDKFAELNISLSIEANSVDQLFHAYQHRFGRHGRPIRNIFEREQCRELDRAVRQQIIRTYTSVAGSIDDRKPYGMEYLDPSRIQLVSLPQDYRMYENGTGPHVLGLMWVRDNAGRSLSVTNEGITIPVRGAKALAMMLDITKNKFSLVEMVSEAAFHEELKLSVELFSERGLVALNGIVSTGPLRAMGKFVERMPELFEGDCTRKEVSEQAVGSSRWLRGYFASSKGDMRIPIYYDKEGVQYRK